MDVHTAHPDHRQHAPALVTFGDLPAGAAIRGLVAACDIALLVDRRGIIETVTLGTPDLAEHGARDWPGQHWADTVLPENRSKINDMLAGTGEPGRWRHVNHPSNGGDLPIRYLTIDTGDDGRILVVGRDLRAAAAQQQRLLRAQQAMERESLHLRQLEARYRLLFDSAQDAIIVIDATSRRMTDINPEARRLTGLVAGVGDGQSFTTLVTEADREAVSAQLGSAAAAAQPHPARITGHVTTCRP